MLDVVEHIEDDVAALAAMKSCLKPGGKILIAVPAHQWMWSAHDVVNHHHRRYSKGTLVSAIEKAGLKPRKLGYFNSLLFPLAAAARSLGGSRAATTATTRRRPRRSTRRSRRSSGWSGIWWGAFP